MRINPNDLPSAADSRGSRAHRPATGGLVLLAALAVLTASTAPSTARADNLFMSGHGDLGIAYEDGEWDLHVHVEGAVVNGVWVDDEEYEADEIVILVPNSSAESRIANVPGVLNYDPIGVAAGVTFWKLEQTQGAAAADNAPFLGIATEEIDGSDFVGPITLTLLGVSSPSGNGHFSVYQNAVPGPDFFFSTFDPSATVNGNNTLVLAAGVHDHFNYGFTEPGLWEVTIEASGILNDGLGTFTSGVGTYTFMVIPEPSSVVLAGMALVGLIPLVRRSGRRTRVPCSRSRAYCTVPRGAADA